MHLNGGSTMKQVSKVIALFLLLSIAICALTACADVTGTYVRATGETLSTTFVFDSSSNSVVVTERVGTEVREYPLEYELSEDGKFISFYYNGELLGSEQFEQGEDYIKVGIIKYFKQ